MTFNESERYVLKGEELRQQRTVFVFVVITYVVTWRMLKVVLLNQIVHMASMSAIAQLPFQGTLASPSC